MRRDTPHRGAVNRLLGRSTVKRSTVVRNTALRSDAVRSDARPGRSASGAGVPGAGERGAGARGATRRHTRPTPAPALTLGILVGGVMLLAGCASSLGDDRPAHRSAQQKPSAGRTSPSPAGSAAPKRPADPAADRALLKAAKTGDARAVRAAIERGARLETRDAKRRTPLLLAVTEDHVEAAKALVEAGADPDARD